MSGPGSEAERAYDAGAAIDSLLREDDGKLLGAMAHYKASMVALFGREGFFEIAKRAIEGAKTVTYFSARSRREMDPGQLNARLRVDDAAAIAAHPEIAAWLRRQKVKGDDLGTGGDSRTGIVDKKAMERITSFKANVIFEEVCRPIADEMNEALRPHWGKAKEYLISLGADKELQRMLVTNMFAIGVNQDPRVHSRDKMVTMRTFI